MNKELTLKEIQTETLNLMKKVHKICVEQNLRYILAYGTLLGAIRHNGFIPWDDDFDIMMPRSDYEKFARYFFEHRNELLPLRYFSPETVPDYPNYIARISDTSFMMKAENEKDCGMGIFIDIYPIDGMKDGKLTFAYRKARFFSSLYFMKTRIHFVCAKGFLKNILKKICFGFSKIISLGFLKYQLEKISKKHNFETSGKVGCVVWGGLESCRPIRKASFENVILHNFEDAKFYIPKNYEEILKQEYGDFMKLPPESERIGHHFYKIFRK